MKRDSKRAGQSTRDMADERHRSRVRFVLVVGVAVALLILVLVSKSKALGIGGGGVLVLLLIARLVMDYTDVRARKMEKEERRAIRGAKGEERIGSILDELREDYLVIHDIASPYGNIDHVVISRQGGVFLIETKAHGGRVSVADGRLLVNGHGPEKDFIAQALRNTYWLREEIRNAINVEVWITPVVVFTNAFVERTAPIKSVRVINKKYLPSVLRRPDTRTQSLAAWENRERIQEILQASNKVLLKGQR